LLQTYNLLFKAEQHESRINGLKKIQTKNCLSKIQRLITGLSKMSYFNHDLGTTKHFDSIKNVVTKLIKNDATSIENVLDVLSDSELQFNLIYIKSNFGTLPDLITKLESSDINLGDSLKTIEAEKN